MRTPLALLNYCNTIAKRQRPLIENYVRDELRKSAELTYLYIEPIVRVMSTNVVWSDFDVKIYFRPYPRSFHYSYRVSIGERGMPIVERINPEPRDPRNRDALEKICDDAILLHLESVIRKVR